MIETPWIGCHYDRTRPAFLADGTMGRIHDDCTIFAVFRSCSARAQPLRRRPRPSPEPSSDSSGGALPGVALSLRNTGTGLTRAATSDRRRPIRVRRHPGRRVRAARRAVRVPARRPPAARRDGGASRSRCPLVMEVGGVEQAVTVSGGASAREHRDVRAELPRRRAGDRNAAAQRPQLHRPRAAAAGRAAVSVARRRVGRRARPRHERQRPGLSLQRLPARRHAAERLHERPGRQRRRHRARHGSHPRVPRRVQRLQRRVRPQLRRADQRADQVGHQHAARQRLRVPPQRRARRAQLLRRRRQARLHAQPVRRRRSAVRCSRTGCSTSPRTKGCASASARRSRSFVPDDNARARHPARRPGHDQRRRPAVPGGDSRCRPGRRSAAASRRTRSRSSRSSIRRSCRGGSTTRPEPRTSSSRATRYDDGEQRLPTDYPAFPRSFISTNQFFTAEYRNVRSERTLQTARFGYSRTRIGQNVEANLDAAAAAVRRRPRPRRRHRHRRHAALRSADARRTCGWRRTSTAASTT